MLFMFCRLRMKAQPVEVLLGLHVLTILVLLLLTWCVVHFPYAGSAMLASWFVDM